MIRSAKRYTFKGEALTIREWSERTGIEREVLYGRIVAYGWPIERALTEPNRGVSCYRGARK